MLGKAKRLNYKVSKKERKIYALLSYLGKQTFPIQIGMKVRAVYSLNQGYCSTWFYGKVEKIGFDKQFIFLRVEKTSLKVFAGKELCFNILDKNGWVEPFEY